MTTLAANSSATLALTDYDSVTISCRGPVIVEAVSGLGLAAGKIAEFDGTRTFGPFAAAGSLKLTTQGAPAEYEVANGEARGGAVEYSIVNGQVVGLAGPGGVIPLLRSGARKVASIKPCGAAAVSATALVTRHVSMILPLSFKAYKARVYNAHTAPITHKIGVTTQSALGDGIYNDATWDVVTFAGATSIAVPAGSGAVPEQVLSYSDSDVMYSPSADYENGTILAIRNYCATASNTRFDVGSSFSPTSLASTGMYAAYATGVDGVTAPATFAGQNIHFSTPPVELICYTDKQIKRVGLFGSSTLAGTGDTTGQGWAWLASAAMSSDALAYMFVNHSQPSRTTAGNLAAAIATMPTAALDAAVFTAFSVNDSDRATAAGLNRILGQMRVFIDECMKLGITPYLQTAQATTGQTGAENANRKQANTAARELAAAGWCGLFDIAGLFSDDTQANGSWLVAANTTDGTHPNHAGTVALASYADTVFH